MQGLEGGWLGSGSRKGAGDVLHSRADGEHRIIVHQQHPIHKRDEISPRTIARQACPEKHAWRAVWKV